MRVLRGEPTRPFSFKVLGQLCSIGGHRAVRRIPAGQHALGERSAVDREGNGEKVAAELLGHVSRQRDSHQQTGREAQKQKHRLLAQKHEGDLARPAVLQTGPVNIHDVVGDVLVVRTLDPDLAQGLMQSFLQTADWMRNQPG